MMESLATAIFDIFVPIANLFGSRFLSQASIRVFVWFQKWLCQWQCHKKEPNTITKAANAVVTSPRFFSTVFHHCLCLCLVPLIRDQRLTEHWREGEGVCVPFWRGMRRKRGKGKMERKGAGRGVGDSCPSDAELFFSLHRGWRLLGSRVSSKSWLNMWPRATSLKRYLSNSTTWC